MTSVEKDELQLVGTDQAAALIGLRKQTMAKHRVLGIGCTHVKLGARVFYRLSDLRAWIERNTRRSTSKRATAR
jgi:hypothetical protein